MTRNGLGGERILITVNDQFPVLKKFTLPDLFDSDGIGLDGRPYLVAECLLKVLAGH